MKGHILVELMRRGWALDVGGQTAADRSARRSPPMTLYMQQPQNLPRYAVQPQGYDPYNHIGRLVGGDVCRP